MTRPEPPQNAPQLRVVRILWPGHAIDPVMWAEADGLKHWDTGFVQGFDQPGHGNACGPYSFRQWHGALTDAMHWAYQPHESVPKGWRLA